MQFAFPVFATSFESQDVKNHSDGSTTEEEKHVEKQQL